MREAWWLHEDRRGEGQKKSKQEGGRSWHEGHEAHQMSVCVVLGAYFMRGDLADRSSLPGVGLEVDGGGAAAGGDGQGSWTCPLPTTL